MPSGRRIIGNWPSRKFLSPVPGVQHPDLSKALESPAPKAGLTDALTSAGLPPTNVQTRRTSSLAEEERDLSVADDSSFQDWVASRPQWHVNTRIRPVQTGLLETDRLSEAGTSGRQVQLGLRAIQRQVDQALGYLRGEEDIVQAPTMRQAHANSGDTQPRESVKPSDLDTDYESMSGGANEEGAAAAEDQTEEVAGAGSQLRDDTTLSDSVFYSPASTLPSVVATPASLASLRPLDASTPSGPASFTSPVRKRRAFKAALQL